MPANEAGALLIVCGLIGIGLGLTEVRLRANDVHSTDSLQVCLNHIHHGSPDRATMVDLLSEAGLSRHEAGQVVTRAADAFAPQLSKLSGISSKCLAWLQDPGSPYLGYDRIQDLRLARAVGPAELMQLRRLAPGIDYSLERRLGRSRLRRMFAAAGMTEEWSAAFPESVLAKIHDSGELLARVRGLTLVPLGTAASAHEVQGYELDTRTVSRRTLPQVAAAAEEELEYTPELAMIFATRVGRLRLKTRLLEIERLESERVYSSDDLRDLKDVLKVLWPSRSPSPTRLRINEASPQSIAQALDLESLGRRRLLEERERIWFLALEGRGRGRIASTPAITLSTYDSIARHLVVRQRGWSRLFLLWGGFALAWFLLLVGLSRLGIPTRGAVAAMALVAGLGLIEINGRFDVLRQHDWASDFVWTNLLSAVIAAALVVSVIQRWRSIELSRVVPFLGRLAQLARKLFEHSFGFLCAAAVLASYAAVIGTGPAGTHIRAPIPLLGGTFLPVKVIVSFLSVYVLTWLTREGPALSGPRRIFADVFKLLFFAIVAFVGGQLMGDFGGLLVALLAGLGGHAVAIRKPFNTAVLAFAVLALMVGGYHLLAAYPGLMPDNFYRVRVHMMFHPWNAGHPRADQLALALWSQAAGGFTGTQPGQEGSTQIPLGHSDMMASSVIQEMGVVGLLVLLAGLALVLRVFFTRSEGDGARGNHETAVRIALGLPLAAETLLMVAGNL